MSPLAFGMGKSSCTPFEEAIFYSNKLVFNYNWTDGKDLDIIVEILEPTYSGQLGERKGDTVGIGTTVTFMQFGGDTSDDDNCKTQSVLVNIDTIKDNLTLPNNRIIIDLRATWFSEIGTQPIVIDCDGYEGGTMLLDDETANVDCKGFSNPTATSSYQGFKSTVGKSINYTNREDSGARLARAIIDFSTYNITFIEDS